MLDTGSFQHSRNAEIAEQSVAIAVKEDILRLEVAVNNALLVRLLQSLTNLRKNTQSILQRYRTTRVTFEHCAQGAFGSVLSH